MDKITKLKEDVKTAEYQFKGTKNGNLAKYNRLVVDKVAELSKEERTKKERDGQRIIENAAKEAAVSIMNGVRGRVVFLMPGIDNLR